jgi:tRNA threonylcarbamoyladenosine biosynthesis protein TsaE
MIFNATTNMVNCKEMKREVRNEEAMKKFAESFGRVVHGGELFELVGDVGAGKTTFTKGLAEGMGITEAVQSPTFTISRVYDARDGLELRHYDFYRLPEAGIMANELAEAVTDPTVVTVVEWAEVVESVLPENRLRLEIIAMGEDTREITVTAHGEQAEKLLEAAA